MSQDTATENSQPAVRLDPEAERLKLDQVKAEARRAIAEAEKGALAAKLPPASEVTPPDGRVEVGDDTGLVGRLIAYRMFDVAAKAISSALAAAAPPAQGPRRVLIVEDRNLVATDWPYDAVSHQLASEETALASALAAVEEVEEPAGRIEWVREIEPPEGLSEQRLFLASAVLTGASAAAPAVAAIPGLVSTAAGVAAMFRTDYSIAGGAVTMGSTPLTAAVSKQLLADGCEVVADGFNLLESEIVTRFWKARNVRVRLEEEAAELRTSIAPVAAEVDGLRTELKDATSALHKALGESTGDRPELEALQGRIGQIRKDLAAAESAAAPGAGRLAIAEAAVARFDAFATAVTTAAEGARPPLVAAALRERLHGGRGEAEHTHVLFVGVEGGGQETVTRRRLFGGSGRVTYVGGAEVSYLLLDVARNRTVAAGAEPLVGRMKFNLRNHTAGRVRPVDLTLAPPLKRKRWGIGSLSD